MVDSERGVGRPDRALELGRAVDRATLPTGVRVELAIAMSGARLDLGQTDAPSLELEIPELDPDRGLRVEPGAVRRARDRARGARSRRRGGGVARARRASPQTRSTPRAATTISRRSMTSRSKTRRRGRASTTDADDVEAEDARTESRRRRVEEPSSRPTTSAEPTGRLMATVRAGAAPSATPLDGVDVVLADLDGVVYAGAGALPYAVESLNRGRDGRALGYITNNASRTDASVAAHLSDLGLATAPDDVVTSPQAAMRLLVERIAPGRDDPGRRRRRPRRRGREGRLRRDAQRRGLPGRRRAGLRARGRLDAARRGRVRAARCRRKRAASPGSPRTPTGRSRRRAASRRATARSSRPCTPRSAGSRPSRASPRCRSSRRRSRGSGRGIRSSSATGSTPTSWARTAPASRRRSCSRASTGPSTCSPRPPDRGRRYILGDLRELHEPYPEARAARRRRDGPRRDGADRRPRRADRRRRAIGRSTCCAPGAAARSGRPGRAIYRLPGARRGSYADPVPPARECLRPCDAGSAATYPAVPWIAHAPQRRARRAPICCRTLEVIEAQPLAARADAYDALHDTLARRLEAGPAGSLRPLDDRRASTRRWPRADSRARAPTPRR